MLELRVPKGATLAAQTAQQVHGNGFSPEKIRCLHRIERQGPNSLCMAKDLFNIKSVSCDCNQRNVPGGTSSSRGRSRRSRDGGGSPREVSEWLPTNRKESS